MSSRPLLVLALLAACTQFPELDNAVSESAQTADYPALINFDEIVSDAQNTTITPQTVQGLESRLARLKSRARTLSGPIIDGATRARMARGVRRS